MRLSDSDEFGSVPLLFRRGMRLWQAVRRTEGEATTFCRRWENLPWWYWARNRVLSWGMGRGSLGMGGGEIEERERVEWNRRGKRIEIVMRSAVARRRRKSIETAAKDRASEMLAVQS